MQHDTQQQQMAASEVQRRPMLEVRAKQRMMAVLIQSPKAFDAVREYLKPEDFGPADRHLQAAWQLTIDFHAQHARLPEIEELKAEVDDALAANRNMLDDVAIDDLDKFLDYAFDDSNFRHPIADWEGYFGWTTATATKYLEERLAAAAGEAMVKRAQVPCKLPEMLQAMARRAESIGSMHTPTSSVLFDEGWDRELALPLRPCGVGVFDMFTGSGLAGGEVVGLLGPFGSCKTTIATMLAVEGAKRGSVLAGAADYDGRPWLTFIVTYEARKREVRNRTLGYHAGIARRSLETMKSTDDLSRIGHLLEYERRAGKSKGEYERAMEAIAILNEHLVVLDMTGADQKGVGNEGLREISQAIALELRRRNARCERVVIDYMGAMARRYMVAHSTPNDQLRYMIAGAPIEAKNRIADAFDTPVWLLHQLNGGANSRSPAVLGHHTDAAESKSFGENLDFAFVIGVPQAPDNVALIGCTKHRRQPPRDHKIIRVDGTINAVYDASGTHGLNPHMRKIVRIDEEANLPVGGGAVAASSASEPGVSLR